MTRIIDVGMECRCKKLSTAIKKFFEKYPNLKEWKDTLEYMAENSIDSLSDTEIPDASYNDFWCWALHLDMEDDYFYIAIIERA